MRIVKAILTVAALMGSATAYAGAPQWTVSETSGPVMVSRPGFQASAARGGHLRSGDVVSTGLKGRAVLVRGEEYLVVSPGSRITIAQPKAGGMTQIIQSVGNTLFRIKKMATPHFAVETPYLAAVVKGTTFSVTVTDKGASVQVTEGRVQVATPDGGASYLVTPGDIGMVNRNDPFRLTVQGKQSLTIDSPNRVGGAAAPATAAPQLIVSALDAAIGETVGEGPVKLDKLSGGMVTGDSSLATASTASQAIKLAMVGALPPQPALGAPATDAGVISPPDDKNNGGGSGPDGVKDPADGKPKDDGKGSDDGKDKGSDDGKDKGDDKGKGSDDGKDKGDDKGKGSGDGKDKSDDKGKGSDDGKDKGDDKGKGSDDGKDKGDDKGKGSGDGKDKSDDKGKGSDDGKDKGDDKGKGSDDGKDKGDDKGKGDDGKGKGGKN